MHAFRMTMILACLAVSPAFGDDALDSNTADPDAYIVRVVIKEGDPQGSLAKGTLKVRSERALSVRLNGEANFLSGGEYPIGKGLVPFGATMRVSVTPEAAGKIHVSGTHEDSDINVASAQTGNAIALRAYRIHFAETMKPGETVRRVLERKSRDDLWTQLFGNPRKQEVWMELTVTREVGEEESP